VSTIPEIVQRFKKAGKNIPRLAGAKRMATCYAQRQASETGLSEEVVKRRIRAQLTRNGLQGRY